MNTTAEKPPLEKSEFEALADFRYQLRRFLRFSELLTRRHGITNLQYLLLLQVKGFPGREWANIGELAERLQAHQHGVVSLVSRCEKLGLVERQPGREDRRAVEVHLTAAGERHEFVRCPVLVVAAERDQCARLRQGHFRQR